VWPNYKSSPIFIRRQREILNLFFSVIRVLPPKKNFAFFQVKKTGDATYQKFYLCGKADVFPLVPHFVVV